MKNKINKDKKQVSSEKKSQEVSFKKDLSQFLLQKLGNVEISIEEIYNLVEIESSKINIALSQLELEGRIEINFGKVVKL